MPGPERSRPPGGCLFGVETEYGFAVLDRLGRRLPSSRGSAATLIGEAANLVEHLPAGRLDFFTANGSRVYLDAGEHPEVATPECVTPEEVVIFSRAGDRLLARAARAVEAESRDDGVRAVLWKGNVDHGSQATWASHESYLHEAPQSLLAEQLMTHLVTRVVYTGAGGFDNLSPTLRFVVSPRAFHLNQVISESSTRDRGIFNTRDEPLAVPPYRRLHVLAGESLWSETADYLRVATTALLVAQVDARRRPQEGLDLASPVHALRVVASDPRCSARLRLRTSERLTAITLQRRLLEGVEADLGAAHLPPWAAQACERWRSVLDRLETAPASLTGVLDWPTKLEVLERACRTGGVESAFSLGRGTAPKGAGRRPLPARGGGAAATKLLEIDVSFNRLDDQGIFAAMDRAGALAHHLAAPGDAERAVREPPGHGRARARAAAVRRLARTGGNLGCSWEGIYNYDERTMLDLSDPFNADEGEWRPIPAPRHRDAGRSGHPLCLSLDVRSPRRSLRVIRRCMSERGPMPVETFNHCLRFLETLVPSVPVPVLRRGGPIARPVVTRLFEHAMAYGDFGHQQRVGRLLSCLHEAEGRYPHARNVLQRLLDRGQELGEPDAVAGYRNDLGYVHLLQGNPAAAEPFLERALERFDRTGADERSLNTRANLLECRFLLRDRSRWGDLIPVLLQVNRGLVSRGDWRARKTLRLLARLAEHRGRRAAARGWARRAVSAASGVPTQLHEWDQAYLASLEEEADPAPRGAGGR